MSNNALTVENLNKIYSNSKTKKETKAITDLTFEVKEGEVFGLLGLLKMTSKVTGSDQ